MSEIINKQAVPSYLAEIKPQSFEQELKRYARPPRLKVIQSLAGEKFKPKFQDSDVIIVPEMRKIAGPDEPATFIVTNFWRFYACKNPAQMTGQLNFIREMTFDPKSPVAIKAMKYTDEPCPENPEYKIKYREFLNFLIIFIDEPELAMRPIAVGFQGGTFRDGQSLIDLYQSRGVKSIIPCRWRMTSSLHKGKGTNKWFGLDFFNDPDLFISEEQYKLYDEMSRGLQEIIDSKQLELDLDDTDLDDSAPAAQESRF